MEDHEYSRIRRPRSQKITRLVFLTFLLITVIALSAWSFNLFLSVQAYQSDLDSLEKKVEDLKNENEYMRDHYDEILEINEELQEENKMLRSSTIIHNGNRDVDKVAITIDDGLNPDLVNQAIEHLDQHDVQATFFPIGSAVRRAPETWQLAVAQGHELGNHTYSHPFLSRLAPEKIAEEIDKWQEAVDEALGYNYNTLFFRPPYMDGFTATQENDSKIIKNIISERGMFTVLWDVELIRSLSSQTTTPGLVTDHVLENVEGGSILLLHFNSADVAALPGILSGLRDRGLEPCSLSELLLAEPDA